MAGADGAGRLARSKVYGRLPYRVGDPCLQERSLDVLAPARLQAVHIRSKYAERAVDPGREIGHGHAVTQRGASRHAGDAHQPAHGLRHEVEAGPGAVGTGRAEARDRAVDEAGVGVRKVLVGETLALHGARPHILHQHVHGLGHASNDVDASGGAEIDDHATLVAVDPQERRGLAVDEGRPGPPYVVAVRLLDLYHVGAHVGQEHGAERPGHHLREVEDLDPGQGAVLRRAQFNAPGTRACVAPGKPVFPRRSRRCRSSRRAGRAPLK